jgi:putative ABC transport system permease protein
MDIEAVRAFWQISGVEVVIPMVNMQGAGEMVAGDYRGWGNIVGIDPELLPYLNIMPQQGELSLEPGEVIVGSMVGQNFYDPTAEEWQPITVDLAATPFELSVYQTMSQTPTTREVKPHVSAVLQPNNSFDYQVLMPLQDVMKWNEWSTGQKATAETFRYDRILVRATDRNKTNDVTKAIRKLGFESSGMGTYLNDLNQFFSTMRLMLGGVGGVALLVAAFGVANTMTMAILERTKEIGLMKAIGATDRDVLTVFLIEAGLVGLAGGLAGVGLSLFLRNVINNALRTAPSDSSALRYLPFDTSQIGGNLIIIPSELSLLALVLATSVGLCAGLYPAMRAARLEPVIALKQE